jgi:hypothetical protein
MRVPILDHTRGKVITKTTIFFFNILPTRDSEIATSLHHPATSCFVPSSVSDLPCLRSLDPPLACSTLPDHPLSLSSAEQIGHLGWHTITRKR